jgi:predicted acyl esterase
MKIERDIEIVMRDGARLLADIFRPAGNARVPVIMNLGVYQKDKIWTPPNDLEETANPYMVWETANPEWWVPRGYALVRVDARGSGRSAGRSNPWSPDEARDFFDAIEWAGHQPWCNGAVGLSGISYYAMNQWLVANLQPPSLKAMIPWEGAADMYRDFAFHGGIFSFGFAVNWYHSQMANHLLGKPQATATDSFSGDWIWDYLRHNLDSDWYHGRRARWNEIKVPFLSAGNWSGMGLHLRGNSEAYLRSPYPHNKLRIHAGTHIHPYHSEDGRNDQVRWFDFWLKGIENGVMREPSVKLQIRKGGINNYEWRFENEWPLKRTQWTRMYLSSEERLTPSADGKIHEIEYSATTMTRMGIATGTFSAGADSSARVSGATFQTEPFTQPTEITGPVMLSLWVSSSTPDMDIFVTLRNIDPDGNDVLEMGQQGQPVPVAKGWLRASQRKIDATCSLPFRPYHSHDERQWLEPGRPVHVQVEIWPTSMTFDVGHRLRLDIQPRDGFGSAPYTHFNGDYNTGTNRIHMGGHFDSYLLLPVIPS